MLKKPALVKTCNHKFIKDADYGTRLFLSVCYKCGYPIQYEYLELKKQLEKYKRMLARTEY